jgi:hypothetical protein
MIGGEKQMRHDKYSHGAQMMRSISTLGSRTNTPTSSDKHGVTGGHGGGGDKSRTEIGKIGGDKSGGVGGVATGHAARIGGYARGSNY